MTTFGLSAQGVTIAAESERVLDSVNVCDGGIKGVATLLGNGETYITDLKVSVEFENFKPYCIELEDGYSPLIEVFDFGSDENLLFSSSQTGGSGGYGNYRVYRLKTQSYQLLYDDEMDSEHTTFGAVFKPDGFMELRNNNTAEHTLTVDVKYMDKVFYDKIFADDGSLKGEEPYVNAISFISPSLNPASGFWRLITYRSVAAVAEVNRLGYIVQTLDFDGMRFVPTFTEFSIGL